MKKLMFACVASLLCFFCSTSLFAAEFELKMQTYYPPTMFDGLKKFVERVETYSDGRVKINLYAGGELVASSNILKSVRSGMIDIGHGMGHHWSEMKLGRIESGLPMAWMSTVEAQMIYEDMGLKEIISAEYDKVGVVYLGPTWAAPYQTLTKKPVSSLEGLSGMKIRAVGATANVLSAVGVNSVSLPPEDIYMALTTNQIDGVVYGSASDYKNTKYYEAAEYFNATPLLDPITDTVIISKRTWEKLPPELQGVIKLAIDQLRWDWYSHSEVASLDVIDTIFKDKVSTFGAEDQAQLTKAAVEIWEKEAERSPEAAKAIEIIKKFATQKGRL